MLFRSPQGRGAAFVATAVLCRFQAGPRMKKQSKSHRATTARSFKNPPERGWIRQGESGRTKENLSQASLQEFSFFPPIPARRDHPLFFPFQRLCALSVLRGFKSSTISFNSLASIRFCLKNPPLSAFRSQLSGFRSPPPPSRTEKNHRKFF